MKKIVIPVGNETWRTRRVKCGQGPSALMVLNGHVTWAQSLCTARSAGAARRANGARQAQDLTA